MSNIAPIVPNLPSSTTAVANKYASTGQYAGTSGQALITALNNLPRPATSSTRPATSSTRPATIANTINPLALYDLARANRGLSPLTTRQSAAALQTLATGQPATPPRRQSLPRSALSDLRALTSGIFKFPQGLYHEARQLPNLPGLAAQTLANSSNPIQALGNLASLPGLRMIPGAFVAQQLAADKEHGGQGVQGLLAHPIFTALDILPLASGAAKMTPVAKSAEAAYAGQIESLTAARELRGFDPSTAVVPSAPRPLQTALTRTLSDTGEVVPNALGRAITRASDAFTSTTPGNLLQQTFRERLSSRLMNRGDTFLRETADPRIPTASVRPNVPGGAAAMGDELAIRDLGADIQRRLEDNGIPKNSPEARTFYQRLAISELPDGTPIPPEQMLDLSPELRTIVRDVRDFEAKSAAYTDALPGPNRTKTLIIDGTPEVFDLRTAQRISKAQSIEASAREVYEARAAALHSPTSPSPLTSSDITARLDALTARRAMGEITSAAEKELRRLYEIASESIARPDITRVIPTLRPLAREYGPVTRLIDHLQNGRWAAANKDLAALARTRHGRALPFDIDALKEEVSRLGVRDRVLSRSAHVDERYLARASRVRARIEARHPAPRWDELVQREAKANIARRVQETFATDPNLDTLMKLADEGIYDTITARDPRFTRWVREDQVAARESWQAMKEAGHDPIFFSRVTPKQARRQQYIRLADAPTTLQATRARMMDAAPYVEDVGVIVNQQALDILQRRATQAALDDIGTSFGRSRASLVEEYTPRLLATSDSPIAGRARLDKMIGERWTKFEPGAFGGRTNTFAVEGAGDIYIPRAMAENLRRMYEPSLPNLTAAFDPIMHAFRTSVLPLALRWQVNNLVGGAIVAAVNDPRAFLEMPEVIRQLWGERRTHPAAVERLMHEGAPPAGLGMGMSPEMGRWDVDAASPLRDRISASAQFASGTTARKLYDQARESRIAAIPSAFKRNVERMYGYNQFVDDVVRASIGASQKKRFLAKGFSTGAAEALTSQAIRRAFQAWDDMTPMERSVMRSVVPFYGFAAYATKFALRYPFDHPFRASVLNSITRAELTDAQTGLPEYIRDMILLGDPRANGVVKALNVSPFNPFGGVPSMFTVAGFTGQLNPVITGVLESIGVDVQQGGPQLYPELRYDPETGRLVADPSGNVLSNIIGNTIPQLSGVTSLLGWNDQFNATLRRDPGAAGRMLLSNFGIPILTKNVNIGDQLIKSEMARLQDQETARKEALSTGNLSILNAFPGLAAYGEQVRALNASGQLDVLRPQPGVPGGPSDAGLAYATQAGLTG